MICFSEIQGALSYPVLAYLDPGTGSIILQAVLGLLVGAAFTFKVFFGRIRTAFDGLRGKRRNEDQDPG